MATLQGEGGHADHVRCDVTDEASVAAAVDTIVARHGRLDGAFNCAGISPITGDAAECPIEKWQAILAVNLTGVWLCLKHQARAMLAGSGGIAIGRSGIATAFELSHARCIGRRRPVPGQHIAA